MFKDAHYVMLSEVIQNQPQPPIHNFQLSLSFGQGQPHFLLGVCMKPVLWCFKTSCHVDLLLLLVTPGKNKAPPCGQEPADRVLKS